MTAVFAGHIFRGSDMDSAAQAAEETRLVPAIAELCRREGVTALHGGLAAGADILFAEAGAALRLPVHVVLPFDADAFEASSVAIGNPSDAPARWNARYRAALAGAASLRVSSIDPPAWQRDAWYRTAFREAAAAALLAADRTGGTCLMLAITDDGGSPGAGGTTTSEADWRARGRRLVSLPFAGARRPHGTNGARRHTGLLPVLFLRPAGPEGAARIAAIRPALGEARPRFALAGDGEAVLYDLASDAIAGARLASAPSLRVVCDFGLVCDEAGRPAEDAVLALHGAGNLAGTETGTVLATEAFALEARYESDTVAGLVPADAFRGEDRVAALRLYR
ncbi:MAG: hypothetical protein J0H94_16700 [Rhizobiales bacterium]|nr:hypothetical protein [Hyphomicrobiales bacterium]